MRPALAIASLLLRFSRSIRFLPFGDWKCITLPTGRHRETRTSLRTETGTPWEHSVQVAEFDSRDMADRKAMMRARLQQKSRAMNLKYASDDLRRDRKVVITVRAFAQHLLVLKLQIPSQPPTTCAVSGKRR